MPADWHSPDDVQAWIDLGYASAPVEATTEQEDGIASLYAYFRGYGAKADALLGSPDNVGLEGMSVAQSNGRYDRMNAKAEQYRLAWEGAIAALVVVPESEPVLKESRSVAVPITYRWT
jgi:hypothetical protein